jgi:hypothetical protein
VANARVTCLWGATLVALAAGACSPSAALTACAPGQATACVCPSGLASVRICTNQGSYGACICGDDGGVAGRGGGGLGGTTVETGGAAGTAGAGGAAGTTGGAPGGAAGTAGDPPATGCVSSKQLIRGTEQLIDLFPTAAGIVIVRADALVLVGRDAAVLNTVKVPRPITAASFDGTSLVVADAAMLTVYSAALESQGTVLLTEACVSSVLMDDGVFVCGPSEDWDRVFYTYDIKTLRPIASSSQTFTYHGRPMRRVPGTSYFITVTTDLSPSDFYLYKVLPGGADVVYVNESPYHGDFAATTTMGFDANPAAHLIQVSGLLLRIFGDGCDSQHNSFTSGCFVKDGTLGLLPSGQPYLALANDDAGRLFAVTNDGASTYPFNPLCPGAGCNIQLIDVPSRTVVSQRKHLMASAGFIALRPDPACKMVALGYQLATSTTTTTYAGYEVDLVDYGEN